MSQIQTTKLSLYTAGGPSDDELIVHRLSMYVLLVPGDDTGSEVAAERQGFCYAQRVRRG